MCICFYGYGADLAVIIVHYYDFLSTHKNKEGLTPLTVLATRPSAFRSATKLSWWKRILYHCKYYGKYYFTGLLSVCFLLYHHPSIIIYLRC